MIEAKNGNSLSETKFKGLINSISIRIGRTIPIIPNDEFYSLHKNHIKGTYPWITPKEIHIKLGNTTPTHKNGNSLSETKFKGLINSISIRIGRTIPIIPNDEFYSLHKNHIKGTYPWITPKEIHIKLGNTTPTHKNLDEAGKTTQLKC
ncbi:Hypothetical predicted protein [Mytilus galloprovincialis]|uniref:Uncharacterized protein n=1 Tax=Mytilus galloprovincialis TaxID=29158 RepID=A0A8B6EGJ8_MYTGA|nr:Hypothetical predicted protein [Mytilus galloprovincialis]